MFEPISLAILTDLNAARFGSAVSPEAAIVSKFAQQIESLFEISQTLFGEKAEVINQLYNLELETAVDGWDGYGAKAINLCALYKAEQFVRALPENLPLPECAVENDGSIALDWNYSKSCVLSVSFGVNNRLPVAWIDGTDKGHYVVQFDGSLLKNCLRRALVDGIL